MMGKKVLVVDDDPDVRLFSTTVLEENGYLPLEAENGEEGLRMIKSEKPDLVILDVLMPRQSGIRLFRQLKIDAALKDVKVLILSGIAKKTFLRSQQALTEFGEGQVPEPEFYIEKPVDAEVLASTIKKHWSKRPIRDRFRKKSVRRMKIKKILFVTKFEELGYDALKALLSLRKSALEHVVFMHVIERDKVAMQRGVGYKKTKPSG